MIKNIAIEKLIPHPNNPRKVIGDISELAASIKKSGVFQNLTVVPNGDDTYTIIIGHRRHAAAKEAGLSELPCAVVEMSEKEQLLQCFWRICSVKTSRLLNRLTASR